MAFETDAATVYQIRKRHRNKEVRERVPADYQGVMITDRAGVYDALASFTPSSASCTPPPLCPQRIVAALINYSSTGC
jgi:hypothetical protein